MSGEKSNSHWVKIGMAILVLWATSLVWHDLGAREVLGHDENLTIIKVYQPDLKALLAASRIKASGNPAAMPPLYFFVLYFFWPLVQQNAFMLRFLSTVSAILTVIFVCKLPGALLDQKYVATSGVVGLLTGLLTITLMITVRYAQIARPYTFFMLFSVASAYFLVRAQKNHRWADWAGFVLTSTLNLYTHYCGLLVLAAEGLFAGLLWLPDLLAAVKRHRALHVLISPALAFFTILLLSTPSLLLLVDAPAIAARGEPQVEFTLAFFHNLLYRIGLFTPWLRGIVLGLMAVGLLAAVHRRLWKVILFCVLWLLVPLVLLAVIRTPRPFAERYLIFLPPVAFVLVSMGVVAISTFLSRLVAGQRGEAAKWIALGLLSAILILSLTFSLRIYYQRNRDENRLDLTLHIVEANAQPGDLVLVSPRFFVRPLDIDGAQAIYLKEDLALGEFQTLLAEYQRVWVLYTSYIPPRELQEPMDQWIQARFDHFVRVPIKAITALALYHHPWMDANARWNDCIPILEQLADVSVGNQEAWLRYDGLAAAYDAMGQVYAQQGDSIRAEECQSQASEIRSTAPKP